MIRIDAAWLAGEPLDIRAGTDTALARVVRVIGAAQPHHAYLFANRSGTRLKVLVHDGFGLWPAGQAAASGPLPLGIEPAAAQPRARAGADHRPAMNRLGDNAAIWIA